MMKKFAFLLVTIALVSGCSSEPAPPLKSPCVGIKGSPCGDRIPVNGRFDKVDV